MIDYIILTAYSPFAVIMQLHPGWVRPLFSIYSPVPAQIPEAGAICPHVTVFSVHLHFFASTSADNGAEEKRQRQGMLEGVRQKCSSFDSRSDEGATSVGTRLSLAAGGFPQKPPLLFCPLLSQVGFLQTQVLGCLGCLWFNRNEVCSDVCGR